LIVGARAFPGNPYDGHLLAAQLEQTTILLEDMGRASKEAAVDLGFRGVDADNPSMKIIHRGKYKSLSRQQRRWLKRRQAVEPAIGHLKADRSPDGSLLAMRCIRCIRCHTRPDTICAGSAAHVRDFGNDKFAVICSSGARYRSGDLWLQMNFAGPAKLSYSP